MLYLNENEEKIIGNFMDREEEFENKELILKWKDGSQIIAKYDSFIEDSKISELSVAKYLNADNVFLTPNMTYNPRVIRKPKNCLVNGSVAILIPKENIKITDEQLLYFSTKEYRDFYQIARNYQTRSLNVDACSVYFYGLLKENINLKKEDAYVNRAVNY